MFLHEGGVMRPKQLMFAFVLIVAISATGVLLVNTLKAQADKDPAGTRDPVKLAPDIYKVALENDVVRVLDIRLPAGGHAPMHSHPNYIAYAITPGKLRFTAEDGGSKE